MRRKKVDRSRGKWGNGNQHGNTKSILALLSKLETSTKREDKKELKKYKERFGNEIIRENG